MVAEYGDEQVGVQGVQAPRRLVQQQHHWGTIAIVRHLFNITYKEGIATNWKACTVQYIGKVPEKVPEKDYLSVNNQLSSSQFDFRSGASTEHAL